MTTMPLNGRMRLYPNPRARQQAPLRPKTQFAAAATVTTVRQFHRTLPGYRPTPLVTLERLAHRMGLGRIWVKDESQRFGLKAFKALGASYAICATLAERLDISPPLTFDQFRHPDIRQVLSTYLLVTASDGNHGLAVAWMAAQLGCRSRVILPHGTALCRQEAIRAFGGETVVIEGNYDDAVRYATREADDCGGILVQDTAWEGYTKIPRRVMQGYLTLFDEAFESLDPIDPTHLLVPCGVGALAASLQSYLVEKFGAHRPVLMVIEAAAADCYYRSMAAGVKAAVPVTGDLETIMAGLACGEPTHPGWEILRRYADGFASCDDAIAAEGLRRLAFPLEPDPPVESGECGAVTLGCLCHLMQAAYAHAWRNQMGLGPDSRVLLISTEGATDPESYRQALRRPPALGSAQ